MRLPQIHAGCVRPFSILFAGVLAFSLVGCDDSKISLEDLEAAAATIEVDETGDIDVATAGLLDVEKTDLKFGRRPSPGSPSGLLLIVNSLAK